MDELAPLPELVRDARLQATIDDNLTIHTRPPGLRTIPRQESWKREHVIGHGGQGVIWLERKVEDDGGPTELRAVKGIRISERQSQSDIVRFVRELEALAKFSQEKYTNFFIKCYGWYESPGWLHIAMEYCEHGDLKKYVADVGTLPEDQAQDIASQILGALTLMHEEGIAHRDLKPANILVKCKPPEPWRIKLCDFGLSKRSEYIMGGTTVSGTPGFMPPETIGFPFRGDPKAADPFPADMWCMGETIYQILTGHATFEELGNLHMFHLGKISFPDQALGRVRASSQAIDFIRLLMLPTPWQRLNTIAAWGHGWMKVEAKPADRVAAPSPTQSLLEPPGRLKFWRPPPITDDQLTQASGQFEVTMTQQRAVVGDHLGQIPSSESRILPSYAVPAQCDVTLPTAR
ncbi:kinase-like domain-containing protein [Thelonectria olida]|uniref:Autophagy-related protein 1 n=1 Tax=Thelonectria olida TaxID=1576542 RepID=A0A9P8VRS3_9HYPO|nr:kinase-like domain-containing protein [Thelonectria olida]